VAREGAALGDRELNCFHHGIWLCYYSEY
jgi:hypothetical protein